MHHVGLERRSAFQGRLKHYQKQKFPPGTNTGRGRAAVYLIHHAIQFAVALEMNQLGLGPERAAEVCLGRTSEIQGAAYLAISKLRSDSPVAILLSFDPAMLSDLRGHDEWDETMMSFDVVTAPDFRESLTEQVNTIARRLALINMTELLYELAHRLSEHSPHSHDALLVEMRRSAGKVGTWSNGNP